VSSFRPSPRYSLYTDCRGTVTAVQGCEGYCAHRVWVGSGACLNFGNWGTMCLDVPIISYRAKIFLNANPDPHSSERIAGNPEKIFPFVSPFPLLRTRKPPPGFPSRGVVALPEGLEYVPLFLLPPVTRLP